MSELFLQESQAAEERMKDANWEFNKEVCAAMGNIQNPSKELVELATKFMIMVDQKECSWKLFKVCSLSFYSKYFRKHQLKNNRANKQQKNRHSQKISDR